MTSLTGISGCMGDLCEQSKRNPMNSSGLDHVMEDVHPRQTSSLILLLMTFRKC